jgi:hypothetical protein
MNSTDFKAECKRVARSVNGRVDLKSWEDGWSHQKIAGWEVTPGRRTTHNEGNRNSDGLGNDWKAFTSVSGAIILGIDGNLWQVDMSSGSTSDRPWFENTSIREPRQGDIVGRSGAPFSELLQALQRLEAMAY